jgi:hypothetical protein
MLARKSAFARAASSALAFARFNSRTS